MKKLFLLSLLFVSSNVFATITQNIPNGCTSNVLHYTHNKAYLIPTWTPTNYTCSSGQFLPANAVACVACPSGYTCSGGTYAFNENLHQGLSLNSGTITSNTQYACSQNILGVNTNRAYLIPTFNPNNISITWQREDGTTLTTNTCTYGGAITIPEAPHKTGYKFTGWTVVSQ